MIITKMPLRGKILKTIVRISSIVALICGIICCYLTVESVSLSLSLSDVNVPKLLLWILIAALLTLMVNCFYMVLRSFNPSLFIEHRFGQSILALFVLILLWIGFFLPTNVHALYCRQMSKSILISELLFGYTDYTLWYWILLSILLEGLACVIFLPNKIYDYLLDKSYYGYSFTKSFVEYL